MKKIFICLSLSFLISVLLGSAPSLSTTRGIRVTTVQGQNLDIYKDYHALVVGISKYEHWPNLPNAVNDAKKVAVKLGELGFQVKLVLDPTYRQMRTALSNMVYDMGGEKNRAILFYYAGHGETETLADMTKMGYIIPTDCPLLERNPKGFATHAISMRDIESISMRIKSKHTLMLFDSCFSGSLFALVRAVPHDISEKSALPVRQYITAGREDEQVPDKSMFKRCLLIGLDGDADLTGDGYITGSELGMYLSDKVINYTHRRQHPQYGKINNPDLDRGDFIFVPVKNLKTTDGRAKPAASPVNAQSQRLTQEIAKLRQERESLRLKRELFEERQKLEEERKKLGGIKARKEIKENKREVKIKEGGIAEKEGFSFEERRLKTPITKKKQLAYIPKTPKHGKKTPGKIAIFPWHFGQYNYWNPYNVTPTDIMAHDSAMRLIAHLKKAFKLETIYSIYKINDTEQIKKEFYESHNLNNTWTLRNWRSREFIPNDEVIYKAGKDIGVDIIIVVRQNEGQMVEDSKLDLYLYDITSMTKHYAVFGNHGDLSMPHTFGISSDTAVLISKHIKEYFEEKINQQ